MDLHELIETVRQLYQQKKMATAELADAVARRDASELGKVVLEGQAWLAELQKLHADTLTALRGEAVRLYEETGNKRPAPGVGIRVYRHLRYDMQEAANWCWRNAPALLMLDTKAFEKTAITLGAPVEEVEEVTAIIAKEL